MAYNYVSVCVQRASLTTWVTRSLTVTSCLLTTRGCTPGTPSVTTSSMGAARSGFTSHFSTLRSTASHQGRTHTTHRVLIYLLHRWHRSRITHNIFPLSTMRSFDVNSIIPITLGRKMRSMNQQPMIYLVDHLWRKNVRSHRPFLSRILQHQQCLWSWRFNSHFPSHVIHSTWMRSRPLRRLYKVGSRGKTHLPV